MDQELALAERTSGSGISVRPSDQSETWIKTGRLNGPRFGHTATLLQNGMVLAYGGNWSSYVNGVYKNHGNLSSAEFFNPATGTWTLAGSSFYERLGHTATLLPNGKVLVAGGNPTTNTELFDPAMGQWFATGRLNVARPLDHAATALADGRVLVMGGYDPSLPFPDNTLSSAEIYDPTTQVWTQTGSLNVARAPLTATLLRNGKVLVVGVGGDFNVGMTAELYDPGTGRWTVIAGPPEGREGIGSVARLNDGKVLVTGGPVRTHDGYIASHVASLFDPAQATWRLTGLLNVARRRPTATLLSNGKVLAVGGFDRDPSSGAVLNLKSAELFDPTTMKWTLTSPPNTARSDHTATLLRNPIIHPNLGGRVLVTGGNDAPAYFNSLDVAELYLFGGSVVEGPPLPTFSAEVKSTL